MLKPSSFVATSEELESYYKGLESFSVGSSVGSPNPCSRTGAHEQGLTPYLALERATPSSSAGRETGGHRASYPEGVDAP